MNTNIANTSCDFSVGLWISVMSSSTHAAIATHQAHECITIILLLSAPATLALGSHLAHSWIEAHNRNYDNYATVLLYELHAPIAKMCEDTVGKCLLW